MEDNNSVLKAQIRNSISGQVSFGSLSARKSSKYILTDLKATD